MAAWESIMTALYHITEQTVLAIVLPPWPGKAAGNAKGGKSVVILKLAYGFGILDVALQVRPVAARSRNLSEMQRDGQMGGGGSGLSDSNREGWKWT